MNLDHFIDIFGDSYESQQEILKWFGSYERFFSICTNSGKIINLLEQIDNDTEAIYYHWVLNHGTKEEKRKIYNAIVNEFNDIEKKDDTYVWIGIREDLSELFCHSSRRDWSPREVAQKVLQGDVDTFNDYWTDDVMDNVYDYLTTQNQNYVKQRVKEEILGQTIKAGTELLEDYENEDGEVLITNENVDIFLENYETLSWIIKNETDEIEQGLKRLLNFAEESALYNEVYNDVFKELSEYFDIDKKEWITIPSNNGKKTLERFQMPLNKFAVENAIAAYLDDNKDYNDNPPGYYGSFIGLVNHLMDSHGSYECLSVSFPEYPDWSYTKKNINDNLGDYI